MIICSHNYFAYILLQKALWGTKMALALQITLALVAVAAYLIYRYFTETFDYWKKKGVIFVKPAFLAGSMKSVLMIQEHLGEFFDRMYKDYSSERYVGYFMGKKPTLLVRDPELVKHIMIKDFAHFTDHGFEVCINISQTNLRLWIFCEF